MNENLPSIVVGNLPIKYVLLDPTIPTCDIMPCTNQESIPDFEDKMCKERSPRCLISTFITYRNRSSSNGTRVIRDSIPQLP